MDLNNRNTWNVEKEKTKVVPVNRGETGTISKSYRKYLSNIPGQHETKELRGKKVRICH
jgi:hypothetical protein